MWRDGWSPLLVAVSVGLAVMGVVAGDWLTVAGMALLVLGQLIARARWRGGERRGWSKDPADHL